MTAIETVDMLINRAIGEGQEDVRRALNAVKEAMVVDLAGMEEALKIANRSADEQMRYKRVAEAFHNVLLKERDAMRFMLRDCPLLHVTTCNTAEQAWIARVKAALGIS